MQLHITIRNGQFRIDLAYMVEPAPSAFQDGLGMSGQVECEVSAWSHRIPDLELNLRPTFGRGKPAGVAALRRYEPIVVSVSNSEAHRQPPCDDPVILP